MKWLVLVLGLLARLDPPDFVWDPAATTEEGQRGSRFQETQLYVERVESKPRARTEKVAATKLGKDEDYLYTGPGANEYKEALGQALDDRRRRCIRICPPGDTRSCGI